VRLEAVSAAVCARVSHLIGLPTRDAWAIRYDRAVLAWPVAKDGILQALTPWAAVSGTQAAQMLWAAPVLPRIARTPWVLASAFGLPDGGPCSLRTRRCDLGGRRQAAA